MQDFVVIRDNDGDTFAGVTWRSALEAALPDDSTTFTDAALVTASDAGAARLLLDNNGARRQTYAPPVAYQFVSYDVWGNEDDGWDVNDIFRTGHIVWVSDDMKDEDIIGILARRDLQVSSTDEFSIELEHAANGKPFGRLEKVEA